MLEAFVLTELAVEELALEAVVVAEGFKALTNCCLAFCTHCARFVLICCNCWVIALLVLWLISWSITPRSSWDSSSNSLKAWVVAFLLRPKRPSGPPGGPWSPRPPSDGPPGGPWPPRPPPVGPPGGPWSPRPPPNGPPLPHDRN